MTRRPSFFARVLKRLVYLALIVAVVGLLVIWEVGAWNLVFPNRSHDTEPPVVPVDLSSPSVLVFSKTNGFRHADGIKGGLAALESMARKNDWGLFHTENGAVFNSNDIQSFDVVVFLNASGDMLSSDQEAVFQDWLESGGGWLGIHAAGDSSHRDWQWYRDNLIGADFTAHILGPQFQRANVILENHAHPVLKGIPGIWQHEEEWYSWAASPREEGFIILATLDEESYSPVQKILGSEVDLSMGDHPVVWANCVGEGRSVYMAMGHKAEAFEQPQVRRLLENSIKWLGSEKNTACPWTPDALLY